MALIDDLFDQQSRVAARYELEGNVSLASDLRAIAAKTLIIAAAGEFEHGVLAFLTERLSGVMGESSPLFHFVKRRALEKKYHELFKWESGNANHFFAFFGGDAAQHAKELLAAEPVLKDAASAFVHVGDLRNGLAHTGMLRYPLNDTLDEAYKLYKRAQEFVANLGRILGL